MPEKVQVMDEMGINRAIIRITHEVIEKNKGVENLVMIGIQRRGVVLAKRIADNIFENEAKTVPLGILDITLYRDDLSMLSAHPVINKTDIPFDIEGKIIVMVDDVLYTGRTARAAMDAIMELGRPKAIQFVALVDRGHRELPIRADFIGKNIPTARNELIQVNLEEIDGFNSVIIADK